MTRHPDKDDDGRCSRARFEEEGGCGCGDVGCKIAVSDPRESETMTNCFVAGGDR